jgi:hypothetical protein
VIIN